MAQKVSELSFPLNTVGITYIVKFKQSPFIQKRVKEILFQGWEVPMVAELSEFLGQELMPNNTFGLFYGVRSKYFDKIIGFRVKSVKFPEKRDGRRLPGS